MTPDLERYIEEHISPEPPHLHRLDRDTHLHLPYAHMCSGHLQGRVLKMLVRMIRPRRVLELGTYSSYSAQCLAEGLTLPGATVDTYEIDDELADFIAAHLAECPWAGRITTHTADAAQALAQMPTGEQYDLVFIDANKRHYLRYYSLVLPHVAPGGFIVADNTLWDGKVAADGHPDPQTRGILEFNDAVARDPRVEVVILPLRDGLTIIHKLSTK